MYRERETISISRPCPGPGASPRRPRPGRPAAPKQNKQVMMQL